jgi:hypothetical protein
MSFLHVAFLAGSLTIAVPIVLHLLMRPRPKHLEFPALRFIEQRHTANRRQIRLRHWLLLALRCALLGLLAFALARPSIVASGMLGDEEAPLAAALVFDTSPRMQYRERNQSRLEAAREIAGWLLPQFPAESDVAVLDSRMAAVSFAVDRGAARQRIARLEPTNVPRPLAQVIESAAKLVAESDKTRKEVYIFTDLTKTAWSGESTRELAGRLQAAVGVGIYLIDVGAEHPTNVGITELRLSGDVLSDHSPLRLQADVARVGPAIERTLELNLVEQATAKPSVRGQVALELAADGAQQATFQLRGLTPGIHQGFVKLVGEDALACDDTRWFTVEVREPWRILIAAPSDASRKPEDYALFLNEALAPRALRVKGEAAFECQIASLDNLVNQPLDSFAAVCILDPPPLKPEVWQRLRGYVSAGGGLGIFLGRNAAPIEAFNEPAALELMPGALLRQWRAGDSYLAPTSFSHPVLAKFRPLAGAVAWETLPVFRHWQLGKLAEGSAVVLTYSDGKPALIERPFGTGRLVVMTTPISDPANRPDVWNLLPTGDEPWPFVMLANELVYYLVGSGQEQLNYLAGSTVAIHLGPATSASVYSLTTPSGDQLRTNVDEKRDAIVVTSTDLPGNYLLRAGGSEDPNERGFSVNLPASTGELARATPAELKEVFGETPFKLARDRSQIDRSVSAGRAGHELFPYLMVLVIIALAAEQVISNRFYQDYDIARKKSRVAQLAERFRRRSNSPKAPVAAR